MAVSIDRKACKRCGATARVALIVVEKFKGGEASQGEGICLCSGCFGEFNYFLEGDDVSVTDISDPDCVRVVW